MRLRYAIPYVPERSTMQSIRESNPMKRNWLNNMTGILASAGYIVFTLAAYIRYPLPYSPMNNWLSDLGNPELNPHGSALYNVGITSTGLLLVIFFLGLVVWKLEGNKVQISMLRLTQIFGVLGSSCMVLSGIYPINIYEVHAVWSTSLYVLLSSAFIFSAAMLRYHQGVPRWLLFLGIFPAVMVVLTSFFQAVYVLEWITVLLFLFYVTLLAFATSKYCYSPAVRQVCFGKTRYRHLP